MKPVIFDTDPGIDDAMALLFLHASPDVELLGITTVFGNCSIAQATENALWLCEHFDIDVGVYRGAGATLTGEREGPYPSFVHGEDGLGDLHRSSALAVPRSIDAVEFIIDTVRDRPGEVDIVAVGRMTNIALALERAPDIAPLIHGIVQMGGALGRDGHCGNVTPVAEANVFGDPEAADAVCRADIPLTMVGLDVTQATVMTTPWFEVLKQRCPGTGRFLDQLTGVYRAYHLETTGEDGCYVHDSSAVACLLAPDLFTVTSGTLRVATEGMTRGQTVFAPPGHRWLLPDWDNLPEKQVCIDVRSQDVLDLYLETVAGHFD